MLTTDTNTVKLSKIRKLEISTCCHFVYELQVIRKKRGQRFSLKNRGETTRSLRIAFRCRMMSLVAILISYTLFKMHNSVARHSLVALTDCITGRLERMSESMRLRLSYDSLGIITVRHTSYMCPLYTRVSSVSRPFASLQSSHAVFPEVHSLLSKH